MIHHIEIWLEPLHGTHVSWCRLVSELFWRTNPQLLQRILGICHTPVFTAAEQRRISDLFVPLLRWSHLLVSLGHKLSKFERLALEYKTIAVPAIGVIRPPAFPHLTPTRNLKLGGRGFPPVPPTLWSTTASSRKFRVCSPLPCYGELNQRPFRY